MIVAGVFVFWAIFVFDTSVSAELLGRGMRVYNLGLMDDKRNYIIFSGGVFTVGLIMVLLGSKENTDVQKQNKEEEKSLWEGKRDLSDDGYQIYLVKRYGIEKNDALGKIIANGKLFQTIEEALSAMNEKETVEQKRAHAKLISPELTEQLENEFNQIAKRLENYSYKITRYDKNKGVWVVLGSGVEFEQNIDQLRELLKNFE